MRTLDEFKTALGVSNFIWDENQINICSDFQREYIDKKEINSFNILLDDKLVNIENSEAAIYWATMRSNFIGLYKNPFPDEFDAQFQFIFWKKEMTELS